MTMAPRIIPLEEWGKDHWSTLLYIETRVVDHKGYIDNRQMRGRDEKYPTRLADGKEEPMHSDFDCAQDMIKAGLLTGGRVKMADIMARPKNLRNQTDQYELTPKGWEIAGKLREHMGTERKSGTFRWTDASR